MVLSSGGVLDTSADVSSDVQQTSYSSYGLQDCYDDNAITAGNPDPGEYNVDPAHTLALPKDICYFLPGGRKWWRSW
jgi:hypothetical protein